MLLEDIVNSIYAGRAGYVFLPTSLPAAEGSPRWQESRAFYYPTEVPQIVEHLEKSAREGRNIYFSPQVYDGPSRKKAYVSPQQAVVWADVDNAEIGAISPRPSIAWETSPGRYAALWLLDKPYPLQDVLEACKGIAYSIPGVDRSGWDATQVLRFPGSRNYKRNPEGDPGRILWIEDTKYKVTDFPKHEPPELTKLLAFDLPKWVMEELTSHEPVPADADRSKMLWKLENELVRSGVPLALAAQVLWECRWNKFRDRSSGKEQILNELLKVQAEVTAEITPKDAMLPAVDFTSFMGCDLEAPTWTVVNWLQKSSLAILAGEPKSYKSIIATDMALSVASGKPMFDRFPVTTPVPVLYINEENSANLMQDRIRKIAAQKRIIYTDNSFMSTLGIPFFVMNCTGFSLTSDGDKISLIKFIEQNEIGLVILDPFYHLLGSLDENDANEMRPVLLFLSSLRDKYGCSVLLVHHYNKHGTNPREGQRIRGTSALHGWLENGIYVTRDSSVDAEVKIVREFRAFQSFEAETVRFTLGRPGEMLYKVTMSSTKDVVANVVQQVILSTQEVFTGAFLEELGGSTEIAKLAAQRLVKGGMVLEKQGRKFATNEYTVTERIRRLRMENKAKQGTVLGV